MRCRARNLALSWESILLNASNTSSAHSHVARLMKGEDIHGTNHMPECSGKVSDKAYSCPHCGFPMQGKAMPEAPRKATRKRRANGLGSIVPLKRKSGTIYEVRVNTRIDERGYPLYDVIGRYTDRVAADTALAEYNTNPYDLDLRGLTFSEVFKRCTKANSK